MQRDQLYYSHFDPHQDPPLLRFYTWSEPTVSLGRFQVPAAEFLQRIQTLTLPSVRRPTGGKAILHAGDLTFSLVGPAAWLPAKLMAGHALINQALITGLSQLGVSAASGQSPAQRLQPDHCFATATAADIMVRQGKLIGTAQVRRRQAFLIQGTVYLKANRPLLAALFTGQNQEAAEDLLPSPELPVADLSQLLGQSPSAAQVIAALSHGFSLALGLVYSPEDLVPDLGAV